MLTPLYSGIMVPAGLHFCLLFWLLPAMAVSFQDATSVSCNLVTFIPFTETRSGPLADGNTTLGYNGLSSSSSSSSSSWQNASSASFSLLAAAEMAREHFNARNPVLVPQLANYTDCPVSLVAAVYSMDSANNRKLTTQTLLDYSRNEDVCAVIGPADDDVAQGLASLTEALGSPQISYASSGVRLASQTHYPFVARTLPIASAVGDAVAFFLNRDIWRREAIGIIYEESDYGEQFVSPLEYWRETLGYLSAAGSFEAGNDDSIRSAMQKVKENGFRTIVLLTDRIGALGDVARIADEMDMLGEGYFYVISGAALPPPVLEEKVRYPVDSPEDKLLRGAAVFTNFDNFVYVGKSDPFLTEWTKAGTELLDRVRSMQDKTERSRYEPLPDYFQTETPTEYSSFMYDAVMLAGISACNEWEDELVASGGKHVINMSNLLRSEFTGAAGPFRFADGEDSNGKSFKENFRDATSSIFGIHNIRPAEVDDNMMRRYSSVLTHVYRNKNRAEGATWAPVNGTAFQFFDGTTGEPKPRRETINPHYTSRRAFIVGNLVLSIAALFSFGTGVWVFFHRHTRRVKASQPEFLMLLCLGATMIVVATAHMGFDEDKGFTESHLNIWCAVAPWLWTMGYIVMYGALASKLWRISQLLQLRPRAVQVKHALIPLAALLGCCMLVLIVWQSTDPSKWRRLVTSEGDEPLETFGECFSANHGNLPYVATLMLLAFVTVVLTGMLAWKLRNIQSLAESKWIFAAISVHIQMWLIGIPLSLITNGVSKNAFYLMFVFVCFCFSTSLVGLVVWPKIIGVWRDGAMFPDDEGTKPRV